jgi:hypothetical protein
LPTFIIKGLVALALLAGAPVHTYGDNTTLNEGIVVVIEGNWSPGWIEGCTVVGYEQRGDPGYFFGEC